MPRISSVAVTTRTATSEEDSDFFITVATNVSRREDAEEWSTRLSSSLSRAFRTPAFLVAILDFRDPDGVYRGPNRQRFEDELLSLNTRVAGEVGRRYGNLHAHIVLRIHHRSNLRLNRARLHAALRIVLRGYNLKGNAPYLDIQLIRNQERAIERYLEKQQKRAAALSMRMSKHVSRKPVESGDRRKYRHAN